MFDVTFPSGQADAQPHDSTLALDAANTSESWDDSVLMAEPDADVFGWDDEDEEDDDEDESGGNNADLADDLDDDDD